MMQQRQLAVNTLAVLVATLLLAGCGRAEQALGPGQAPSALPQPEAVAPADADPLSGTADYPAPAGLDAQPAASSPTPTFASRREELLARVEWLNTRGTANALKYQSDYGTAIARGDPPPATLMPTWGPTEVPGYTRPLPGGGYLNLLSGRDFNSGILLTHSWFYDLPNNERIQVGAGAIVYDLSAIGSRSLPEPYQGVLVVRNWLLIPDSEAGGDFPAGEVRVPLPVKDGAAEVLDSRVQSERMLLTIGTTGGSVYVFDVLQERFSAPQPPTLTLAPPEAKPDGTVWLQATGEDQAGAMLSYAWDLDGDGQFETEGNPVQLPTGAQVPGRLVTARVTARSGLETTAQLTLP